MKILFLTTKCPYPPCEGMRARTYNIIKHLSRNHEVFLLSFIQDRGEFGGLNHMRQFCKLVYGAPIPLTRSRTKLLSAVVRNLFSRFPFVCRKYELKEMRSMLRELVAREKFDLVCFDLLHLAHYKNEVSDIPKILVEHNIESSLLRRRLRKETNVFVRLYLYLQWRRLRRYESRLCSEFDRCIVVSDVDKNMLMSMAPKCRVSVIPNGVDTEFFRDAGTEAERNSLIIVGSLRWFPNMDGVKYFMNDIFPRVIKGIPDVKVYMVGERTKSYPVPRRYNGRFIQMGFVEDIRPLISKASVFVVPLRVGGGTRLKILDAMAMGKAIVATSVGCEGLETKSGAHLIVEDTPEGFAGAIIELLKDDTKRRTLGSNARRLVEERYDWRLVAETMDRVHAEVVRK